MHEQGEICLNTSLECLKGPTQIHKHQIGLSPIKDYEKNFTKTKNPNPIFENPQFLNPNLKFCKISKKHEENV